ncbi:MAG: response regulator [Treponema sp.]|nr:response regulator [Candidatus Treponema caballi]
MAELSNPFFANAVHELRTPIQTIIGTLELIRDTELNPEQNEYVRQINFSADILLSLVNDLLDFSKIRSGQFKIEKIPMSIFNNAEGTVDLISIEAHNRGLEIVTDLDPTLPEYMIGDPTRIQQIILNLVKNAVKFTSSGYVCLKVSSVRKGTKIRYEVIDSGIGVPDEKKKLIFQDFVQADVSTSRKYGGTGLGLSICKNLASLMGGQLDIKDNPEGGSIFWFELPLEKCEKPQDAQQEESLTIPESTRILLVDDNPIALNALKKKLELLGPLHIDQATSGEQALKKLKAAAKKGEPYDLALIDMVMPVMDGWRLASEINADRTINSTKLTLMVPEGQMGSEAKMKMLDWFNGYIYKPIKRRLLVKVLNESLSEDLDLEIAKAQPVEIVSAANAEELEELEELEEIPAAPAVSAAPARQAAPASVAAPNQGADDIAQFNCTVLVAEDHPINQKILKTFLTKMGVTVFTADDGNQAVQAIQDHPEIQLIFMDIQMPMKNGVEATIELRQQKWPGIIIACTANSDEADFKIYRENGMDDTLVKPFKRPTVQALLEKWQIALTPGSIVEEAASTQDTLIPDQPEDPIKAIWDSQDMLDTVSHDYNLAEQIVTQFIDQTRNQLLTAKEAVCMQNCQVLSRVAHTLKGSSGSISAFALQEAARKMEVAAKENKFEETCQFMTEFQTVFTRFEFITKETITDWKKGR